MNKDEEVFNPFDEELFSEAPDPTTAAGDGGSDGEPKSRGLRCPKCGCGHFYVVKTVPGTKFIRRRRECRHCGRRITTSERVIG